MKEWEEEYGEMGVQRNDDEEGRRNKREGAVVRGAENSIHGSSDE